MDWALTEWSKLAETEKLATIPIRPKVCREKETPFYMVSSATKMEKPFIRLTITATMMSLDVL